MIKYVLLFIKQITRRNFFNLKNSYIFTIEKGREYFKIYFKINQWAVCEISRYFKLFITEIHIGGAWISVYYNKNKQKFKFWLSSHIYDSLSFKMNPTGFNILLIFMTKLLVASEVHLMNSVPIQPLCKKSNIDLNWNFN